MASLIADAIVDKLVGRYVTVEKKELDIGRGTLTLKGVSVRHDLFDAFSLPFAVRGGEIAELELQIPFTKLKTESVVVTIRNLTLLLSPISETPWDEALESKTRRRAQAAAAPLAATSTAVRAVRTLRRRRLLHRAHPREHPGLRRRRAHPLRGLLALLCHPSRSSSRSTRSGCIPAESTTATTGPRPFAHRECLVCALCAYVLQGSQLPPTPTHSTLNGAELRARLESTSLPADAPAAMRAAHFRCCVEPLSFAVELCSKNIGTAEQLPQHLACLETGRIQLQLQLSEYAHLSAMRAYFSRAQHLEQHRRHRPPLGRRPIGHAREWWRYAIGAVRWQVRLEREPYTWASVKRRGATRRGFVKLHQKCLRKGGVKGLSEGERVSLRQLADSLDAESQLLYEQLAEAALAGEADSPGGLFRRQSSAFVYEVHTERKMELSAEQRAAFAELLDGVDEKPGLHERLSLHARLLVAEVVFTLHAPGSTPPLKLQATLANVGLNAGVSVGAYDADVFAEGFSMTLVRPAAAGGPVPLVAPAPEAAEAAAPPRRLDLAVDSRGVFGAAGFAQAVPALCGRADDAHAKARWQGVARWRWDGEAEGEGRRSRGEHARAAVALVAAALPPRQPPDDRRRPRAPPRRRALRRRRRRPRRPPPAAPRRAAPKKGKKGRKGAAALAAALDRLEGMQLSVEASATPPALVLLSDGAESPSPSSRALVLTADRVGVSGGVGADAAGGVASLQLSLELEALQLSLTRLRGWLPRAALPDAPLERRASRHLSEEGQKQAEAERERLMARRRSLEAEVMTAMLRKSGGSFDSASAAEEEDGEDEDDLEVLAPFGVKVEGSSKPLRQGRLDVSCDASELRLTVSPAAAAAVEAAAARLKTEPPTDGVPAPAAAPAPAPTSSQPSAVAAVLPRLRARATLKGAALVVRGADGTAELVRLDAGESVLALCGAERAAEEGDGADGDGDDEQDGAFAVEASLAAMELRAPAVGGAYAARPLLALRGAGDAPAARVALRLAVAPSLGLAPGAVPSVEVAEVEALCALHAVGRLRDAARRDWAAAALGRGGGGGGKGAGGGRAARASVATLRAVVVDDTDSDAAAAHELGVDAAAVARLGQGGAVTARHSRSGRGPASDDRRLELELCAGAAEVVAAGAGLERRASVASLRLRSRCVGDGEWRATWLSLTAEKGERAELRLPPAPAAARAWSSCCRRRAGGRRPASAPRSCA